MTTQLQLRQASCRKRFTYVKCDLFAWRTHPLPAKTEPRRVFWVVSLLSCLRGEATVAKPWRIHGRTQNWRFIEDIPHNTSSGDFTNSTFSLHVLVVIFCQWDCEPDTCLNRFVEISACQKPLNSMTINAKSMKIITQMEIFEKPTKTNNIQLRAMKLNANQMTFNENPMEIGWTSMNIQWGSMTIQRKSMHIQFKKPAEADRRFQSRWKRNEMQLCSKCLKLNQKTF